MAISQTIGDSTHKVQSLYTPIGLQEAVIIIQSPDRPKSIFVTHAVNPKGIDNMSEHYDNVYITNSYRDWAGCPENVTIIDVI